MGELEGEAEPIKGGLQDPGVWGSIGEDSSDEVASEKSSKFDGR